MITVSKSQLSIKALNVYTLYAFDTAILFAYYILVWWGHIPSPTRAVIEHIIVFYDIYEVQSSPSNQYHRPAVRRRWPSAVTRGMHLFLSSIEWEMYSIWSAVHTASGRRITLIGSVDKMMPGSFIVRRMWRIHADNVHPIDRIHSNKARKIWRTVD